MKKHTAEYIELTDLVPKGWKHWFYCAISDGAPFSWGDNNRTLVTASRFHDHCVDVFSCIDEDEHDELNFSPMDSDIFLRKIENLGETYIDLEN